jgi:hypothetical protein
MLLQTIGQRLSHKPFEWMSWWWGLRWGAFISIHPKLTEETPLWSRDDSSLKDVRLFKLPPDELQAEITRYWEKPFWRRWLSRLFTPIKSKIVVWSYYQQCLSFRDVRKYYPVVEQRLIVYEPEQKLVNMLVAALNRENLALEQRLEKYSGNQQWIQKNFNSLLIQHENKRQHSFLKLMKKYLKKLPPECNQDLVRRKLEKEYQELEKMLRAYLKGWCQPTASQQESLQPVEENPNRDLVYVGPALVAEGTVNPSLGSDLSCPMSSINEWVSLKRQTIAKMLQEESPDYEAIQLLLEQSLQSLRLFIEPQLQSYQTLVNDVKWKRVNSKEAVQQSEVLHTQLIGFFRQSALLFHPDQSFGNEHLKLIKTELFKKFQQFADKTLENLSKGLQTLKRCIPKWELKLDRIRKESEEFRAQFEQRHAKIEANHTKLKAEQAEIKATLTWIQEQLEQLNNQLTSNTQESPEASTSFSFRP